MVVKESVKQEYITANTLGKLEYQHHGLFYIVQGFPYSTLFNTYQQFFLTYKSVNFIKKPRVFVQAVLAAWHSLS